MTENASTMRDFDLLIGDWDVRHRRLRRRLAGDTQWNEFGGTMRARAILSGHGNFDENVIHLPGGTYQACTLRYYNAGTGLWTIHWIDGRNPRLDPPMIGSFADGVGTFYGDDEFEGRPIKIRFLWTQSDPARAQWEQAFSINGTKWETNWSMEFTRAD